MSAQAQSVVGDERVIVPPKKKPEQAKFRWPPDLVEEIRELAAATDRTINETGEMLMRWAVQRAKAELEATGDISGPALSKKK